MRHTRHEQQSGYHAVETPALGGDQVGLEAPPPPVAGGEVRGTERLPLVPAEIAGRQARRRAATVRRRRRGGCSRSERRGEDGAPWSLGG